MGAAGEATETLAEEWPAGPRLENPARGPGR